MCVNCQWLELLEEIEDLVADVNGDRKKLSAIYETIEDDEHCTDQQREAVENIARAARER